FGVFGFALLIWLVQSDLPWSKQVFLSIPLLLIWQNAHPSLAIGTAALLGLVNVWWLQFYRDRTRGKPVGPTLVLLLTIVGQFATPLGSEIIAVTQTNTRIARDWLGVSEWLPPWDPSVRGAMFTFWMALGLSLLLLVRQR